MPPKLRLTLWTTEPCHPPRYLALSFDREGKVLGRHLILARDDREARTLARAKDDQHAVELWDWLRFISRFEPDADHR